VRPWCGKQGAACAHAADGWNNWNSFATTITEAQALENARIMAQQLLPGGLQHLHHRYPVV